MPSNKATILVAGGKGSRMGADLPKQYLCLGKRPILMHTIERFYNYANCMHLILVLPKAHHSFWAELCKQHQFKIPHCLAEGGQTRFDSVRNGLSLVPEHIKWVAIHDGVRPFVSTSVIDKCFRAVEQYNAVIPVVEVFETLRFVDGESSKTIDRSRHRLVQTPQVFSSDLIRKAYRQEYNSQFTDDASVVESLDYPIHLVEGNRDNIKITTPFDLKLGEALLDA